MTMKTKRTLAIGGGTALCAALAVLIAARFAPDSEQLAQGAPETSSTASVNVKLDEPNNIPDNNVSVEINGGEEEDPQSESELGDFIEGGGTEVNQDFPEPEPEQKTPPKPPKIEDEKMLTNPDTEPTYEPAQTTVTTPEKSDNANINSEMHGQKKDGMIYINGFGWVKDEGGGGEGEYLEGMYENGNKIGSFG